MGEYIIVHLVVVIRYNYCLLLSWMGCLLLKEQRNGAQLNLNNELEEGQERAYLWSVIDYDDNNKETRWEDVWSCGQYLKVECRCVSSLKNALFLSRFENYYLTSMMKSVLLSTIYHFNNVIHFTTVDIQLSTSYWESLFIYNQLILNWKIEPSLIIYQKILT